MTKPIIDKSEDSHLSLLLKALSEVICCENCNIKVTEASMKVDIEQGHYNVASWPPFFNTNSNQDDDISPSNAELSVQEGLWWPHMSAAQRDGYFAMVAANIDRKLTEDPKADEELAVQFAHYQVDYHIQQHYLANSSVLTLCRDSADLQDMRQWKWKMADLDSTDPTFNASQYSTQKWLMTSDEWEWPNDENSSMKHQTFIWKKGEPARKRRLAEVRAKWILIMAERKRQRAVKLLALRRAALAKRKQQMNKSETYVTVVRVYCGGMLLNERELLRSV
ncbi:hypothetical protein N7495_000938 [Penicillium taxi]|uniref:uncharacterized protein n=1 Tax=Penicillium taxi TaxID=168475 RepID=UPI0025455AD8|nr:uncharacterized protein N7495_000938 [Penicillium taxi]KAJ5908256.1 hypothetical protein N7495_000938 [Penicillium taxi]